MSEYTSEAVNDLATVIDVLRWTVSQFYSNDLHYGHGTDNGWDEAVALILQALNLPMDVDQRILQGRLTRSEKKHLLELVEKRVLLGTPVPYLVNVAWFCNLPFYVDERVLIPRSPIAELIENQFSPWFEEPPQRILDLGTGSGCIAIAAAVYCPQSQVIAVDIDQAALEVAKFNMQQHQVEITLVKSDFFVALEKEERFDLIISNPPYVPKQSMATLPKEYTHEPQTALLAHDEGLEFAERILRQSAQHLTEKGYLIMEVGESQDALAQRYPKVPFLWLEFALGGEGVFLLEAEQLRKHF